MSGPCDTVWARRRASTARLAGRAAGAGRIGIVRFADDNEQTRLAMLFFEPGDGADSVVNSFAPHEASQLQYNPRSGERAVTVGRG